MRKDVCVRDVRGDETKQMEKCKYFGLNVKLEVEKGIKAGWKTWREVSGVMSDN